MNLIKLTRGYITITTEDIVYEIGVTGGRDFKYSKNGTTSYIITAKEMFNNLSELDFIPVSQDLLIGKRIILKMEFFYSPEIEIDTGREYHVPAKKWELLTSFRILK